jgi:hypothetical protein
VSGRLSVCLLWYKYEVWIGRQVPVKLNVRRGRQTQAGVVRGALSHAGVTMAQKRQALCYIDANILSVKCKRAAVTAVPTNKQASTLLNKPSVAPSRAGEVIRLEARTTQKLRMPLSKRSIRTASCFELLHGADFFGQRDPTSPAIVCAQLREPAEPRERSREPHLLAAGGAEVI